MGYLEDAENRIDEERERAQQRKLQDKADEAKKEAEKANKSDNDNSLL
jgi:hypothetical protein